MSTCESNTATPKVVGDIYSWIVDTDRQSRQGTVVFVKVLAATGTPPAPKPSSSYAQRDSDFQYRLNVPHLSVCCPENSRHSNILDKCEFIHKKLFRCTDICQACTRKMPGKAMSLI